MKKKKDFDKTFENSNEDLFIGVIKLYGQTTNFWKNRKYVLIYETSCMRFENSPLKSDFLEYYL